MNPSQILLGTCAWSFEDWRGNFYPARLSAAEMLGCYAERLPTVEIDSTFYAIPAVRVVEAWWQRTPDDFRFAAKMPKVITHEKRLRGCTPELHAFLGALRPLGRKLSSVLLQFPESFGAEGNRAAFEDFVRALPPLQTRFAVEFRHPSWGVGGVDDFLREHQIARCWNDLSLLDRQLEEPSRERLPTADFLYVRLIGDPKTKYRPEGGKYHRYGRRMWSRESALRAWARTLRHHAPGVNRIYVYVNNHYEGASPVTCQTLAEYLGVTLPEVAPEPPGAQLDLFG